MNPIPTMMPGLQPPPSVRSEAAARGWTLTGFAFQAASGVTYWNTTCGMRIGWHDGKRQFVTYRPGE